MNRTRRPNLRYPDTRLVTVILVISLTVMAGLLTESKSAITDSIADLLMTCDQCGSNEVSNLTLN